MRNDAYQNTICIDKETSSDSDDCSSRCSDSSYISVTPHQSLQLCQMIIQRIMRMMMM